MDRAIDRRSLFKLFAGASVAAAATASPLLATASSFGRIETFTELPNDPEIGDVQVIGSESAYWTGERWETAGSRGPLGSPVTFTDPMREYTWTVYPGWEAKLGETVMCHYCYASMAKLNHPNELGWWVRPANGTHLTCGKCGGNITTVEEIGRRRSPAFVKRESVYDRIR